MFTVNKNPSQSDLRKFGVVMFIGFFVIGAIMFFGPYIKTRDIAVLGWTGSGAQYGAIALQAVGIGIWILSYTAPKAARRVYIVWMTGGGAIGMVMTTILLTVLFFLLLPVFSVVVRTGDPLRKKLTSGGTYWEKYKRHEASIERMKRPF